MELSTKNNNCHIVNIHYDMSMGSVNDQKGSMSPSTTVSSSESSIALTIASKQYKRFDQSSADINSHITKPKYELCCEATRLNNCYDRAENCWNGTFSIGYQNVLACIMPGAVSALGPFLAKYCTGKLVTREDFVNAACNGFGNFLSTVFIIKSISIVITAAMDKAKYAHLENALETAYTRLAAIENKV